MKILHVAETIKGGVASVMQQLVAYQAKKYDVSVLVPDSQAEELAHVPEGKKYLFQRTGRNCLSLLSLLKNFIVLVLKNKPAIIHIHSSFAGLICRISLIFLYPIQRPIVIYCPHAFSFLMATTSFKVRCYAVIERCLQFITHRIICTSYFEQQQAINYGINRAKLCVIYNGIDFIRCDTVSPYDPCNHKKKILFVGRFDRQKGYDYLIELIKRLDKQQFQFTIIGDSVHENVERLKADNVNYLGWLNYQSIIPYFQHSMVLVMPSRWESFGLVAVEAESFGLPVLANNCSALPEVVNNGNTGYLFDFESDMLSIINLLNSKTEDDWRLMKKHCIDFVTSRFSALTMNKLVDDLYIELISKSK